MAVAESAGAKPLSPVDVTIAPLQAPRQGKPVEFELRAAVSRDTDNLQISISVPPSVKLLSGELSWQGALLQGQEKRLRFTAILPAPAMANDADVLIQADASVTEPQAGSTGHEHARLGANAAYHWQAGGETAASATHSAPQTAPTGARMARRNGITIREYKLGR